MKQVISETETIDLEPCPFCGGDGWYWSKSTDFGEVHFVTCNKCTARVIGSTREGALGYWNHRYISEMDILAISNGWLDCERYACDLSEPE